LKAADPRLPPSNLFNETCRGNGILIYDLMKTNDHAYSRISKDTAEIICAA